MDFLYQIFIIHNRPWSQAETICLTGIAVVMAVLLIWCIRHHRMKVSQAVALFLLILFLEIVVASTILTRRPGVRSYKLIPFWSWYGVIVEGDISLLSENFLNCLLLMPAGFLLPFICNHKVRLHRGLLFGLFISSVIEICQLVLKRGLFEWDDIIHNSLGCMLGCLLANWVWERISRWKSIVD